MTHFFINLTENNFIPALDHWHNRLGNIALDSLYVSCPEMMAPSIIMETMDRFKNRFSPHDKTEVTVECHPRHFTFREFKKLADHGVTRWSFYEAPSGMDLSFLPDINIDDEGGVNFDNCHHISVYDMTTFEEFDHMRLRMAAHDLIPYDRHHFCAPRYECQYLKGVLEYKNYIGIGANTHSRYAIDGKYYAAITGADLKIRTKELFKTEVLEEFLLQNFSLYQGVNLARFEIVFGQKIETFFDPLTWQNWIAGGEIVVTETHCRLNGAMFFRPENYIAEIIA